MPNQLAAALLAIDAVKAALASEEFHSATLTALAADPNDGSGPIDPAHLPLTRETHRLVPNLYQIVSELANEPGNLSIGRLLEAFNNEIWPVLDLTVTHEGRHDREDARLSSSDGVRPELLETMGLRLLDEYGAAIGRVPNPRSLSVVSALNGWGGTVKRTLENVGAEVGLTRERVRQINKMTLPPDALRRQWPTPKVVIRAVTELEQDAPMSCAEATERMYQSGYTATHFEPGSLLALCTEMDIIHNLAIVGDDVVTQTPPGSPDAVKLVWAASGQTAFANLETIAAQAKEARLEIAIDDLRSLLGDDSLVLSLPDDFFYGATHIDTAPVSTIRRMLSVNSPLQLGEVHDGLERRFKFRGLVPPPPLTVIAAFCEAHEDFIVRDGRVSTTRPLQISRNPTIQQQLVEILREAPYAAMTRNQLMNACRLRGLKISSVTLYITYGELLTTVATNIHAPIGTEVPTFEIERLHQLGRTRTHRGSVDAHFDGPDKIVLDIILSDSTANSGVISIGTMHARAMGTEPFHIDFGNEGSTSHVRSKGSGQLFGLQPMFTFFGAGPGDRIIVTLDLTTNKATGQLVD